MQRSRLVTRWEVQADGTVTDCSAEVEDVLGIAPSEVVGKPFFAFVYDRDVDDVADAMESVLMRERSSVTVEVRMLPRKQPVAETCGASAPSGAQSLQNNTAPLGVNADVYSVGHVMMSWDFSSQDSKLVCHGTDVTQKRVAQQHVLGVASATYETAGEMFETHLRLACAITGLPFGFIAQIHDGSASDPQATVSKQFAEPTGPAADPPQHFYPKTSGPPSSSSSDSYRKPLAPHVPAKEPAFLKDRRARSPPHGMSRLHSNGLGPESESAADKPAPTLKPLSVPSYQEKPDDDNEANSDASSGGSWDLTPPTSPRPPAASASILPLPLHSLPVVIVPMSGDSTDRPAAPSFGSVAAAAPSIGALSSTSSSFRQPPQRPTYTLVASGEITMRIVCGVGDLCASGSAGPKEDRAQFDEMMSRIAPGNEYPLEQTHCRTAIERFLEDGQETHQYIKDEEMSCFRWRPKECRRYRSVIFGEGNVSSQLTLPIVLPSGRLWGLIGTVALNRFSPTGQRIIRCDFHKKELIKTIARSIGLHLAYHYAEQARVSMSWQYETLFRFNVDALCCLDLHGAILRANPSLAALTGTSEAKLFHCNIADFVHPGDVAALRAHLSDIMWTGHAKVDFKNRWRSANGSYRILAWRWSADKQNRCIVCCARDVTAEERFHKELHRARRAAESAAHAKTQFLINMSHEIRTPMNGVKGMAALLQQTSLTLEQRDYVDSILVSGEHLLLVINDILDFGKIEHGKTELEVKPLNLYQCVEQALDLSFRSEYNTLSIKYYIDKDVPSDILGDATRLRQILTNLLANSFKFTKPPGEVRLTVRVLKHPVSVSDSFELEFACSDTGCGIAPENQSRLFKPFSQADNSVSRQFGGTGLGLAISYRLVSLMGGSMRVVSEAGRGSTFFFTIRAKPAPSSSRIGVLPASATGRTALVATSCESSGIILSKTLTNWGLNVRICRSAEKMLQTLVAEPVHFLILDCDTLDKESECDFRIGTRSTASEHTQISQTVGGSFERDNLPRSFPGDVQSASDSKVSESNVSYTVSAIFRPRGGTFALLSLTEPGGGRVVRGALPSSLHLGPRVPLAGPVVATGFRNHSASAPTSSTYGDKVLRELQLRQIPFVLIAPASVTVPSRSPPWLLYSNGECVKIERNVLAQKPLKWTHVFHLFQRFAHELETREQRGVVIPVCRPFTGVVDGGGKSPSLSRPTVDSGSSSDSSPASQCDDIGERLEVKPFHVLDYNMAKEYPIRILVVEDQEVNRKLLVRFLEKLGYHNVPFAADGAAAVAMVQLEHFDIILMDIQMPEMDGITATKLIRRFYESRRDERPLRPSVIAMTANAMKGDKEACFLAGMDDYLSKPLEFPVVVEKLALWAGRTLELKSVQLLAKESDRRRSTEGTAEGSTGPAAATV